MSTAAGPLSEYICIVLAAGLGKRLEPATLFFPKPVLPLCGEPLCLGTLRLLTQLGAQVVHINSSHLKDCLESTLRAAQFAEARVDPFDKAEQSDQAPTRAHPSMPVGLAPLRFWTEQPRLEVGGALARIWQELIHEGLDIKAIRGVLVVSGDIVSEIPLLEMIGTWEKLRAGDGPPAALMVTRADPGGRSDMTWVEGDSNQIIGFGKNAPEGAQNPRSVIYASFKVMGPEVMPSEPGQLRFASAAELLYRPLVERGKRVTAMPFRDQALYFNVGTPEEYQEAKRVIQELPQSAASLRRRPKKTMWTGPICQLLLNQHNQVELRRGRLSTVAIEESLITPSSLGNEDRGYTSFTEGLIKLIRLLTDEETKKGPLDGDLFDYSDLIILIKLSKTFPVKLPESLLVGGDLFAGLALSQRVSRKESREWCSLLIVPASEG